MTYTGSRFKYDIFVSYSHGVTGGDRNDPDAMLLRDWSRRLATDVCNLLALSLNRGQPESRRLKIYLDKFDSESTSELRSRMNAASADSAILLFLASDYALGSDYCRGEIESFLTAAAQDGRERDSIVIREVQKTSAGSWLPSLCDADGQPPFTGSAFYSSADPTLPSGIIEFQESGRLSGVSEQMLELKMELHRKLQRQRELEEVHQRRAIEYRDRPVIFLQSDARDPALWQQIRDEMWDAFVVNPDRLDHPSGIEEGAALGRYPKRKQEFLRNSEALILLRCQPDDDIGLQYAKAMYDRRRAGVPLPMAGLNACSPSDSLGTIRDLPWVHTDTPDWKSSLSKVLKLDGADAA